MADTTRLLSPDDPEWDRWVVRAPHDFYHLAAYHSFAERMGEGCAAMVVHGTPDRFLAWPYLVRPIEDGPTESGSIDGVDAGRCDATSVYGYTGPIGCGLGDAGFLQRAWSEFRALWAAQRLVTLFTKFHPLLGNDAVCRHFHADASRAGGELTRLGRSVSMDLGLDREARRMGYPQVLRQEIKESERRGLVVAEDRDWSSYPRFAELYRGTMRANQAEGRYLFPDAYFADLRQSLGGLAHLAVAEVDGETAAVLLFTVCGGIAEAHLTGVDPKHRALSPLKALLDGAADIARKHGATRLHLGAGRGGQEDSLFAFKARFSPIRHDFWIGGWVLDVGAHDGLVRARSDVPAPGFFPPYRAPVPAAAV